ncbi:hypothetical protein SAMN05216417_104136 [Nitrosospira multiformis]|uniref:asparagine synthase (glutamine-hydrolyzing) n=2 Tax=Nitrosospira multiformis TaxID=1231 RepID=A0A1I7GD37_9PROT|nr:hypothetical protein SAMN05216417_104136 [Nitrosospira multiformis]
MNEAYFYVRRDGTRFETRGSPNYFLGHQIATGRNARPDGIFAGWSWGNHKLAVHNDRYGFYPLFYYCKGGEFCISPSIVRLIKEGADTTLDDAGLAVFLRLGFFIGEDTPFKYIRALPPAATLEWDGGVLKLASGGYVTGKSFAAISRDEAIDRYIQLFRQSIQRRLPPEEHFAVPLSGGRDSRHILLELLHNGCRPTHCLTTEHFPPRSNEDVRVAAALTHELGLSHIILEQKDSWFKAENRKNPITNFCSDEHAWYMVASDFLTENFRVTYDGIAGDVLSAGLFVTPLLLNLFRSNDSEAIANEMLRGPGEKVLEVLLTHEMYSHAGWGLAVAHLQSEIEKHLDVNNPIGSFFFWNRTRREIALVPYGLLGSLSKVFSPYLDHDLFDFLTSLPVAMLEDQTFHTDTILRAYPQYAHIPYEDKKAPNVDASGSKAVFGRALARYLLLRKPSHFMRNSFLMPRLFLALLSSRSSTSTGWYAPLALYLYQLESFSRPQ